MKSMVQDTPSRPDLLTLQSGAHVCLVYGEATAHAEAIAPFFAQGLAAGERCIYVADDLSTDDVSEVFTRHGIDVHAQTARGALKLWTRDNWRQPGELGSVRKAVQVLRIIEDAISDRFKGLRFAIEMTWTRDPDIDSARLRHWEATLDQMLPAALPLRVICSYSQNRLSPEVIEAGLATHPIAAVGERVNDSNPHHASEEILRGAFTSRLGERADLDRALDQLRTAPAA